MITEITTKEGMHAMRTTWTTIQDYLEHHNSKWGVTSYLIYRSAAMTRWHCLYNKEGGHMNHNKPDTRWKMVKA